MLWLVARTMLCAIAFALVGVCLAAWYGVRSGRVYDEDDVEL